MPVPPFESVDTLRRAFAEGLRPLLAQPSLGAFILSCANATYDAAILQMLDEALRDRFDALQAQYRQALAAGLPLDEVDEDLLVFLKMAAIGFDSLQPTESRREGHWQLQFNHLRSFRPKRISQQPPQGISAPFNPQGFHFNKPFMQKEVFWRGELCGESADLYYNKYPFADLHTLLVPQREREWPQYLQQGFHDYAWRVTAELGATLPGVGIGYNSYGAFASVNHLHFQMYVATAPMPAEDPVWQHNGGDTPYPASCLACDTVQEAWLAIGGLHRTATPYSLLYRPGRCYLFPRRPQGEIPPPSWSSGFTWSELAGAVVTFNRDAYTNLAGDEVARQLADCSADAG